MLEALRYEAMAHQYGTDPAQLERAKATLFETFCPRSARWRKLAVQRALGVLQQAAG